MKNKKLMWGGRDNVSIPYMIRFCFIAGTQILMRNDATKNIEDIDVGDIVKSWNEITNKVEDSKVVKLIQPVHGCHYQKGVVTSISWWNYLLFNLKRK